jgi:hypothetical protein
MREEKGEIRPNLGHRTRAGRDKEKYGKLSVLSSSEIERHGNKERGIKQGQ